MPDTQTQAPATQPRIVLNQLYAAVILMLAEAVAGIAGSELTEASTAISVGTALIGAGAALLPVGSAGRTG
jgi:hypothetical protein